MAPRVADRSRGDLSRLCGNPRRERVLDPARSGLGLVVSVGTPRRQDPGGRHPDRGSFGVLGDRPGPGWGSYSRQTRCGPGWQGHGGIVQAIPIGHLQVTSYLARFQSNNPPLRVLFLLFYSVTYSCSGRVACKFASANLLMPDLPIRIVLKLLVRKWVLPDTLLPSKGAGSTAPTFL